MVQISLHMPEVNELGQSIGTRLDHWQAPALPTTEVLEGTHCRLERLSTTRHASSLFAANAEDTTDKRWTYLPYGPFSSELLFHAWVEQMSGRYDPYFFAILDRSGAAIGVASYLRIDPSNGSIEVGHIHFSPRLQNTIAATEAMYLMMAHAFELGYRRYEWKCDALNEPSRAAAQRLGFSFEGVFRQATIVKGRNRDTAWFSIIDQEWPELQRAYQSWLKPENFDEQGRQRTRLSELTRQAIKPVSALSAPAPAVVDPA